MRTHTPLAGLLLAILAGSGAPAGAVMCTLDDVPAATLLLPYFEVADPPGITTLFSLNNAKDTAALAHVTLWTDWSQPTAEFDVYLTGYDVVTVNLRDVVSTGFIPITADLASDAGDTISPRGAFSADASFFHCNLFFPFYANPVLQAERFERVFYGHRGLPVPYLGANRCMGAPHGDGIARGYLTIDSVSQCSTAIAVDAGYFIDGGDGVVNDDNVLWGDYYLVDPTSGTAFGERLVAIEADPSFNSTSTPTAYTFYGRYSFPTGGDNREPLGTVWAARVLPGIGRSDLIVWRDSTADAIAPNGFPCSLGPDWEPLNELEVFFFDEQENATELCNPPAGPLHSPPAGGPGDVACFPLETGRYQVDVGNLAVPASFGWLYLNLNLPADAAGGDIDFGSSGLIAQSYVAESHTAGTIQVGLGSLELASACVDELPLIDP